jgi:18S rRNA (adenine1779-N6/adenine1780-N6)-dimethyltransferase
VMDMIESNYRTYCAQNEIPLEDGPSDSADVAMDEDMDAGDDDDAIMEVDDDEDVPAFFREEADKRAKKAADNPNRKKKGKVSELVRAKVKKVLEDDTQLADKRARLCDEGDFLAMLYAFNQEGIHFT